MTNKKENIELEEFKYLIDSRNLSDKKRKENANAILKARAFRLRERSNHDIILAKLMQLKLKMEEFLNSPNYDIQNPFSYFLRMYVDTIYDKRKNFAIDMSINPLLLSQVLNNHRDPQEKFMLRLIVHSENSFKAVCEFDPKTWYRIFYKEKVDKLMSTQKDWRSSVEKFVTNSILETNH